MMQALQRNRYVEMTVQTANSGQLLIMLFDGAIRFCKQAIEAIEDKRFNDANVSLQKTQDIITEFIITLDRTSPIAETLLPLYDYYNRLLIQANIKKSAEPVREVLGYLTEMKETWVQAALIVSRGDAHTGA